MSKKNKKSASMMASISDEVTMSPEGLQAAVDSENEKDLGRRMRIAKETAGWPNNPETPSSVRQANVEIIRYTARENEPSVLKEYVGPTTGKVRRTKIVKVNDCRYPGQEPFKTAKELFSYMVSQRGYRWVRE